MRLTFGLLLSALLLVNCIEGPTGPKGDPGPKGEKGDPGQDIVVTVYSGVLIKGELISSDNPYWEIFISEVPEKWIVLVYVRSGPDYAWFHPMWDILMDENEETSVAIYQDQEVVSGYEYRIVIAP